MVQQWDEDDKMPWGMEIFKAETLTITTVCSKQRLYVVLRSELRLL